MPKATRTYDSPLDRARAYEVVWQQVSDVFSAARGFDDVCYVYAVGEGSDGPVKIGKAKDPIGRLRQMQTGNSRRLRIEHILLGARATEEMLQRFWESYAIKSARNINQPHAKPGTEWFKTELRGELFPILATAGELQCKVLQGATGNVTEERLQGLVHEAHIKHDFVMQGQDEVRLLGAVGGYVTRRQARI